MLRWSKPWRSAAAAVDKGDVEVPQPQQRPDREGVFLKDTDLKQKIREQEQKRSTWRHTLHQAYNSLGVIYGDIGTATLYVYGAILWSSPINYDTTSQPDDSDTLTLPSQDEFGSDVVGMFSIIFWTLTLVALVKYVLVVLKASDTGEGGTIALYAHLCRIMGISPFGTMRQQAHQQVLAMKSAGALQRMPNLGRDLRHTSVAASIPSSSKSKDSNQLPWVRPYQRPLGLMVLEGRNITAFFRRSKAAQRTLLLLTMVATGLAIGDDVVMPAFTVVSATTLLQEEETVGVLGVTLISILVIVVLFVMQHIGTSRIAFLFSPIVILWLLANMTMGMYNLSVFGGAIFKGINPQWIVTLFSKYGSQHPWRMFAGSVLCVAGAETMFGAMGHFTQASVAWAFTLFVYPCLIITYAGQGAYLMKNIPEESAFWDTVPTGVLWPVFILAIAVSLVSGQAAITNAFALIRQCSALGMFPKLRVIHTDKQYANRIFIPVANYSLMLLCVVIVIAFGTQGTPADNLANAYGVAVTGVMLTTTCILLLTALVHWNLSLLIVVPLFLFYGAMEGVFMAATLFKVPHGGWVPLAIALGVFIIMYVWWSGCHERRKVLVRGGAAGLDSRLIRVCQGSGRHSQALRPVFPSFHNLPHNHSFSPLDPAGLIAYVPSSSAMNLPYSSSLPRSNNSRPSSPASPAFTLDGIPEHPLAPSPLGHQHPAPGTSVDLNGQQQQQQPSLQQQQQQQQQHQQHPLAGLIGPYPPADAGVERNGLTHGPLQQHQQHPQHPQPHTLIPHAVTSSTPHPPLDHPQSALPANPHLHPQEPLLTTGFGPHARTWSGTTPLLAPAPGLPTRTSSDTPAPCTSPRQLRSHSDCGPPPPPSPTSRPPVAPRPDTFMASGGMPLRPSSPPSSASGPNAQRRLASEGSAGGMSPRLSLHLDAQQSLGRGPGEGSVAGNGPGTPVLGGQPGNVGWGAAGGPGLVGLVGVRGTEGPARAHSAGSGTTPTAGAALRGSGSGLAGLGPASSMGVNGELDSSHARPLGSGGLAEGPWGAGAAGGAGSGGLAETGDDKGTPSARQFLALQGRPDRPLARVSGLGIYHGESPVGMPLVMRHFLRNVDAIHEVCVVLTVRCLPMPTVRASERLLVRPVKDMHNFYQVVARYGYQDKVDHSDSFVSKLISTIMFKLEIKAGISYDSRQEDFLQELEGDDGAEDAEEGGLEQQASSNDRVFGLSIIQESYLGEEGVALEEVERWEAEHTYSPFISRYALDCLARMRLVANAQGANQGAKDALSAAQALLDTATVKVVHYRARTYTLPVRQDRLSHRLYNATIGSLYSLMEQVSFSDAQAWHMPRESTVELGIAVEI